MIRFFLLLKRRWDERKNNFIGNACSSFNKLYLMPRLLTVVLGWFMTQSLVLLGFKMLIMLRPLDMMQMEEWTGMIQWPLLVYVTNFRSGAEVGFNRLYCITLYFPYFALKKWILILKIDYARKHKGCFPFQPRPLLQSTFLRNFWKLLKKPLLKGG